MPLVLCITTALMDHLGPCDWTLPDMGVAQCFLGSPRSKVWNNQGWSSFFSSPEFLYFHSILLALQAANILFFMLTVYYLVDHWRNSAAIIKSETKGNFLIVLKLFFIMGGNTCPGVFNATSYVFRNPLVWRVCISPGNTQDWSRRFFLGQIFSGCAEFIHSEY